MVRIAHIKTMLTIKKKIAPFFLKFTLQEVAIKFILLITYHKRQKAIFLPTILVLFTYKMCSYSHIK